MIQPEYPAALRPLQSYCLVEHIHHDLSKFAFFGTDRFKILFRLPQIPYFCRPLTRQLRPV